MVKETRMTAWIWDPGTPEGRRKVEYTFGPDEVAQLKELGGGNAYRGLVVALSQELWGDRLPEAGQGREAPAPAGEP